MDTDNGDPALINNSKRGFRVKGVRIRYDVGWKAAGAPLNGFTVGTNELPALGLTRAQAGEVSCTVQLNIVYGVTTSK